MPQSSVLVVDDEESIRHFLSLLLKKEGYVVHTAADGAQALDALASRDFDAVLCDLRMPNLDGVGLLEALRQRRVTATVIVMSAYADHDDALEAIKAGAFDYIAKPFKKDEVLFALKKAEERQRLRSENESLRAAARGADSFARIVARSEPMRRVFDTVRKVADYKSTVLLSGESGTGKEMVARALHTESGRASKPFITVNCGAIPEPLLESELFGHVRGAFTDANRDKNGLFLEADGGTLFLDEIGDMPLALQVKLLRVLQEGEVRRVGETRTRPVDVRVVAASVHELGSLVSEGRFREDLFYRLNVLPIRLPPLRERPDDIPLLVEHFVHRHNKVMHTRVTGVSPKAMSLLTSYHWPGNVRELENVVERALVLSEHELIQVDALPDAIRQAHDEVRAILDTDELSIKKASRTLETILIRRALEHTGGNRTAAARLLEISHRALLYKIKDYFPEGGV
ncbi:MAG: sigma-54-dependent Fis family transcriptional regulator [Myxococcales bacterium]|nr:sigma-54-dependent Fis family transcriptional regulator [Myxococcales bacterium]MCB9533344.1 sigma-54-dependent Fis family transcriptional regulator [Myxococcales bacterium]